MRVLLSWLAEHVDVDVPVATLAEKLTFAGIEIGPSTGSGTTWPASSRPVSSR